ncbi:hypothetical protein ACSBR2_037587 [Camellia fascicularis]
MLKDYIQGIRAAYTKDFASKDITRRQIAVATYLIDKLALRAGNEKRALFDEGYIYVGVLPLYKVEKGKQAYYCYDKADLKRLQGSFPPNASYNIQRFKGLGEMMPLQLWETTLDPERRLLKQLVVEDTAEANVVFSSLMGSRIFPE